MAIDPNTFEALPLEPNTLIPAEPEVSPVPLRSEFGKGLRSGLSGLGASTDAALAAFLSEPGQPYYQENMAAARRQQREAAAAAPRIQKIQEIKGLRDAFDWFGGTAGQAAASSLPSLAASLAGPLRAGAGAFTSRLTAGAAGAFLPESGETVLSAPEGVDHGTLRRTAALRGATSAALEAVVPALLPGQVAKAFHRDARAGARQALGVVVKDAGAEALTEAAQDYTGHVAQEFLKTGSFHLPDPDWDELLNAAAAGAVGGGLMGGIPGAAQLARAAVQPAVPLAEQGVDRAKDLFRRVSDRTEQALRDEGEFLGGRDTVPPEIAAKGPGAIYDFLDEADKRRVDLAKSRAEELRGFSGLTDEQRQELDSFSGQEHKQGVQRRVAEMYYPRKVDEVTNAFKNKAWTGIKSFFGARKANLQDPDADLTAPYMKGPSGTTPRPQKTRLSLQEAVDQIFERDAAHLDRESRDAVLNFVASAMSEPNTVLPLSVAKDKNAVTIIDRLAKALHKFGYAPRGPKRGEIKAAVEDAKDRSARMHSALRMMVDRSISPEMRDAVDLEDVTDFVGDYVAFGNKSKDAGALLLALFGPERARSVLKIARNLGYKREGRGLQPSETTRYAPELAEEAGDTDVGESDTEGLTETDKGLVYARNGKPFARGSKEFEEMVRGLRASKTHYRLRTFRDVLERSGLEEKEVKQALKDTNVEDPVVFDTTLEDEDLSDSELDSIVWAPEKGDPEGKSVFEVVNEAGETVKVSAVALVNTMARREGTQGRSSEQVVAKLFGEGVSLLANSPRVQSVDMKFKDDLLVQIRPQRFLWKDIKASPSTLSSKDLDSVDLITEEMVKDGVNPDTAPSRAKNRVYEQRAAARTKVDTFFAKLRERMEESKDYEEALTTAETYVNRVKESPPPSDATEEEKVYWRAMRGFSSTAVRDLERDIDRLQEYDQGEQELFVGEKPTERSRDKEGPRKFQEETGKPLVAPNPQLTSMQRAVSKAIIGMRSAFARSPKQAFVKVGDKYRARKPEERFGIKKWFDQMLEMALDERTPLAVQRMMFSAFNPRTQRMEDLNGKHFEWNPEAKKFYLRSDTAETPKGWTRSPLSAAKTIERAYAAQQALKTPTERKSNKQTLLTDQVRARVDDLVLNNKYAELDTTHKALSFMRAAVARYVEIKRKPEEERSEHEEDVYFALRDAVLPSSKGLSADSEIFLTEADDWNTLSKEQQQEARALLREALQGLFNLQNPGTYTLTKKDQKEIREYIDKVLGPKIKVVFEKNGVDLGSYGNDEIRLLLRTRNQKDVHHHEALHALFERMSGRDKDALLRAAQSAPIYNKLKALIGNDPKALKQLQDPEERVAYMYQFWASKQLSVGSQTETIFQKIWKAIRDFFGVLSNSERAELIMQHFHEGKFRDKWFETERSFTERQLQKFETFLGSVGEMAEKLAFTAQSRLRDTEVPALIEIADAMRPEKGEGHISRKFRTTNKYLSKLNEVLRGVSEEDLAQAVAVLRFETKPEAASPAVQRIVRDTRALLEELNQYLRVKGVKRLVWNAEQNKWDSVDPGYIKNYFPRVWSTEKLMKEREPFVDMLRTKYPTHVKSREAAEAIWGNLVQASGEGDLTNPDAAYSPFAAAVNARSLNFVKGEDIAPWLEKDYVNIMSTYVAQAVRRGEYTSSFGAHGQWLRKKIAEALTQGATPEQLETAVQYIRAVDGTLGHEKMDPKWQRILGGATVYQNVRLLPFAIFSSLIDPLGIGLRSNNIGASWKAFKRGIANMGDVLRKEETRDEMFKIAEEIGTIEAKGMMEALGQMYSSMYLRGWPKKINDALFKYNLMDGWNRQMRIAATEQAMNFIESHLRKPNAASKRYLEELGLKLEDKKIFLKPKKGIKLFLKDGLEGDEVNRLHAAVMKFVDSSVLRPDATQRPIWASDPRWAFLFHLKQFSYSFYETIVKRALSEAHHGNFYPLYVLGSYVPFMMAADFAKDMLLNGGEPPEWKKNWGAGDYVWYGVERAGLLGPSQYLVDAGEFGPQSLLGPTVEQIVTATQNPGLGLKKALPGHQVFS